MGVSETYFFAGSICIGPPCTTAAGRAPRHTYPAWHTGESPPAGTPWGCNARLVWGVIAHGQQLRIVSLLPAD